MIRFSDPAVPDWSLAPVVAALCFAISMVACAHGSPIGGTRDDLEVLGLRSWTIPMLEDSVQRYRPGATLRDASCAETLRDSLGFPDAAVLRFRDGRVVLTVIEPRDTGRVVLRFVRANGPRHAGAWDSLATLAATSPFVVEFGAAMYPRHARGEQVPIDGGDSAVVRAVWELLAAPRSETNRDAAIQALLREPEADKRKAAALYLIRYPDDDSTWHALVDAMRDAHWGVRSAANAALGVLRRDHPRRVDWSPAAGSLRYLLAGTTLVFHTEVVQLLLTTGVSAGLGPALLTPAAEALLREQAAARHEYVRVPAAALLRRLQVHDR